ncbi:MAG: NUDIX domain-containing protein [Chloroflexia bacterium]|nr:NUDIX domain-containing protein [Chloroflexia bacterium]
MSDTTRPERFTLIVAVHLFLLHEGNILLSRRYNTGYADGQYSVIAGHLDGREEIKVAMIREAAEEAGIEIAPADLEVIGVMHRLANDERVDFFLAASSWQGELRNCEPDKCDDLAWFEIDDLPENVVPYVRRAIENHRRSVWFDSFGWE